MAESSTAFDWRRPTRGRRSVSHLRRTGQAAPRFCYGLAVAASLSACASSPAAIVLPQGPGVPFAAHAETLEAAVRSCRAVRTMELVMALRGTTGATRVRGRVRAALARPASLRLEGLAPFGASRFILAARPGAAVLLLPRARQVVHDATPGDLLYALTGLQLAPDDLRAVLTGCVVPDPRSIGGRTYGDEWVVLDLAGDATVYLQRVDGVLAIVAGTRGPLAVEYAGHGRSDGVPRRVRVRVDSVAGGADVTAELSQVSTNVEPHPEAFVVQIRDYEPITLDELRAATPLRDPASTADRPESCT